MDANGFERLTEGQKECLRLFHARFEVKDIARRIDRSPVTVHQRLAAARRHLGVDRSVEAARLLAEHEAGEASRRNAAEDPPIPQTTSIAEKMQSPVEVLPCSDPLEVSEAAFDAAPQQLQSGSGMYGSAIYGSSRMGGAASDGARPVSETQSLHEIPLPFPTRSRPENDMGLGAKLIYVVVLAALVALVFGGMVAALNGLSELF